MSSKHGKFTRQKGCTWWLFQLFFGDVYRAYSRKTLTHHGFFQGRFVESATDPCLALHGWSSRRVPTLTTHPHSISVCKPKRRLNGIVSQGDLGHFWGGVLWVLSRALWVWWIDRQWLGLLRRQPIYIPLSFCVGIPKCESNAFERGISLKKWDLFDEFLFFFATFFKKCSKSTVSFSHTSKYLWWYVKVPWEFWWKKVQSYLTDSKPWVNFMLDWAEQPSNVIEYNQIIKKIHT